MMKLLLFLIFYKNIFDFNCIAYKMWELNVNKVLCSNLNTA
jgi:hypothetical protein